MQSESKTTAENVEKACTFIDEAARESPDLIVLPEFFNTGYIFVYRDFRNLDRAERENGPTMTAIKDKARQHQTNIVATIYEEHAPGLFYDTAIYVDPQGDIIGKYRKTHPPAIRSLEKIHYRYGSKFPVFNIAEFRVGTVICYDTSFPETTRISTLHGAELIVAPFCSPAYSLSPNVTNRPWEVGPDSVDVEFNIATFNSMLVTRARDNSVYLVFCNHVGTEVETVMTGHSVIIDPVGRVLADAGDTECVIYADLDLELVHQTRVHSPMLRDRRPDLYKDICIEMEDLPI
jgi:N-carbamoylputrescine amidase